MLERHGFETLRASYMFTGTFPFFAADSVRTVCANADARLRP